MRPIRVYADTSVFGGAFDEEFAFSSRIFFKHVRQGRFRLTLSALLRYELEHAPKNVRDLFIEMSELFGVESTPEAALLLRDEYLRSRIVGSGSIADALHVAAATVLRCRLIVSWNFKHIVHFQKILLYNRVNRQQGYQEVAIHTPQEVIGYEEETV